MLVRQIFYSEYKLALIVLVVISFALLGGGCALKRAENPASEIKETPVLRVGAIPAENVEKTRDQFKPLMAYLEKKTGCRTVLFVAEDYSGVIDKMAAGELDIAMFGPFSYIMAAEKAGARAFVVEDRINSGTVYNSIFIVRSDSPIQTIEQLKGHTLAFTDPVSTSGYLIPRAILKEHGIDIEEDLTETIFAGGHDAAILTVKKGITDAAAIADSYLRNMKDKGIVGASEIRVIHTSDAIPGSVWAYGRGLSPKLLAQIKTAFLSVAAEDKAALGMYGLDKVTGFAPVEDKSYDIIRQTARLLGIDQE